MAHSVFIVEFPSHLEAIDELAGNSDTRTMVARATSRSQEADLVPGEGQAPAVLVLVLVQQLPLRVPAGALQTAQYEQHTGAVNLVYCPQSLHGKMCTVWSHGGCAVQGGLWPSQPWQV